MPTDLPTDLLTDLLAAGLLTCPACRGWREEGFRNAPLAEAERLEDRDGRPWQGLLRCTACGQLHPVIDGVAVILPRAGDWVRQQERALLWRVDLDPRLERWLRGAFGDDADPNWRRQMLAVYTRDPATGPLSELALRGEAALRARLQGLVTPGALALELGCGAGQRALEAAALGARVLAMDLDFGPLRLLSRALAGEAPLAPRWRHGGGDFVERPWHREADPGRVALVAGDALDPPLAAGAFDLGLAFNLLDNVSSPVQLLRQLYAALRPGGALLLTSPYDWSDRATPRAERPGEGLRAGTDPDPAAALRALLTGAMPALAPELDAHITWEDPALPWVLERHDRSAHVFFVHALEARRPGA